MRYIFLLLPIIFFYSCNSEQETKNISDLPKARVVITDTLEIEYQGNLKMADYNRQNKLFMSIDASRENNVILVFDRGGNIHSTFDNKIAGANAVSGKINAVGFDESNDGYIIVSSGGVYYFNSNWERLQYIPNPERGKYARYNPKFRLEKINRGGKDFILTQLLAKETGYNIENKKHYDFVEVLTVINPEDSSFSLQVGFDETSNYRKESKLYAPYFSFFDYAEMEDKVIMTFTNEKKLYYYYLDQSGKLSLQKTHEFDFDYYKIQSEFNYGDDFDIYKAAFDSKIESLTSYKNRVFTTYRKDIDNAEFINDPKLYYDYRFLKEFLVDNSRYCLNIIEDGKKLYKDVILPNLLASPAAILEKNEIVFHLSKTKYEFDNEVFLICKIKKK